MNHKMAAPIMNVLRNVNRWQKLLQASVVNTRRVSFAQRTPDLTRNFSCQSVLLNDKRIEGPQLKKLMDSLTDKFTEARELLGDARESQGTVYFTDDMEEAQTAVADTLEEYKQLLDKLPDAQRQEVISTLGLRMEELKAQQKAIEDELIADH